MESLLEMFVNVDDFCQAFLPNLEQRMRPGAFSKGGFLGANESLLAVLEQDLRTLEEAHLPAEQIADGLERVLGSAMKQRIVHQRTTDQLLSQPDRRSLPITDVRAEQTYNLLVNRA